MGKKPKKIHARENTKKKNSCKEEGKEVQRVSPAKKIPAQAKSEKKNSCKLKFPHLPHHFSNGPSLSFSQLSTDFQYFSVIRITETF